MIITTEIEFNIVINDVSDYYNASSLEDLIMYSIKLNYEKTCYQNQFISEFVKVIRHSQAEVIGKDLMAKIRIYAIVQARVIKYDELDIVSGMTVSQIIKKGKIRDVDMIECKNDHCIALMILDPKIKNDDGDYPYSVGDIISIKVGKASYTIGKKHITVAAYPFVVHQPQNVIFCIKQLEESDKQYLTNSVIPMLNDVLGKKQELEKDKDLKNRIQFFESLLYPYKSNKRKDVKASELKNAIDLNQYGFVSSCSQYSPSELKIRVYANVDANDTVINDHAVNVYQKIILDSIKFINTVLDMANLYKEASVFESHKYLFDMYENSKQ